MVRRLRFCRSARFRSRAPLTGWTPREPPDRPRRTGRRSLRVDRRNRGSRGQRRCAPRRPRPPVPRWPGRCRRWRTREPRRSRPPPNQLETCGRPPLLGGRLPDRPDADVVDGLAPRGLDLLARVGGEPDDRVRAHDPAGLGGVHVVLADVHSVCAELHGEVGVVVDDEERAVGVRETAKRLPGALDHRPGMLSVAELDHPGARGHGRVEKCLRIPFPGKGIADEVEPRPPQALPPQLTD